MNSHEQARLEAGLSEAQASRARTNSIPRSGVPPERKMDAGSAPDRALLKADDVHRALAGGGWGQVLVDLGALPVYFLRRNGQRPVSGPCPACGGRDRFTFDDRKGHGDFLCRKCGPGDGFDLLMRVHRWDFTHALMEVARAIGIRPGETRDVVARHVPPPEQPARLTARARELLRTACMPEDVPDVVAYLLSRNLWPLRPGCPLRAHPNAQYSDAEGFLGRFPALVAPVVDIASELVTAHVTWLQDGAKLRGYPPRKLVGKMRGRMGCAVRLAAVGPVLGIAEGIETALAAMKLFSVPVWAATSASSLAKFEPPEGVERLIIFADRNEAGFKAAFQLKDRVGIPCELRIPTAPAGDWADVLEVTNG